MSVYVYVKWQVHISIKQCKISTNVKSDNFNYNRHSSNKTDLCASQEIHMLLLIVSVMDWKPRYLGVLISDQCYLHLRERIDLFRWVLCIDISKKRDENPFKFGKY